MKTDMQNTVTEKKQPALNMWAVYGICLLISSVFFLLFGFNSPIYPFNSDHDFNWFITMGRGLNAGKLPYRDLFEQKGPIVYFVMAFCCLFKNYNIAVLIVEIFCLSLFFFFAYRIAIKRLNIFYTITAILVLALAIFTSWCRMRSADAIEEFCLPIYAYFLLCWLEFLTEKRSWNWVRALCLGLCFGVLLWAKYTLVYFMITPMIIWFIQSIRAKQFRTTIFNILMMLLGIVIVTAPIILYFAINHALHDLLHVYFIVNMTAYSNSDPLIVLKTLGLFFAIGPVVLVLILWGVIRFAIKHWKERTGWLVLTAFIVNLLLLSMTSKLITYYFIGLIPYAILGAIDILDLIGKKFNPVNHQSWLLVGIAAVFILITIPCSSLTYEIGRSRDSYAPLVIADTIHEYENKNHTKATLCCYKIGDFGFYNTADIIPNTYYFASNYISDEKYPEMGQSFNSYAKNQVCDFIITDENTWNRDKDFLLQYYQPYSYEENGEPTFYNYHQLHYFFYRNHKFILLIKK